MHENDLCMQVFGKAPDHIDRPGGTRRQTVGVTVDAKRYAFSRRTGPGRAALEASALRDLAHTGCVPELIHSEGRFVIQEWVTGDRLTTVLNAASPEDAEQWVKRAASALASVQNAAASTGLARKMPKIGTRPGWIDDLVHVPQRLAETHGFDVPHLDLDALRAMIRVRIWRPVKWDARPGNAICTPDGRVVWFDWEHSGRRQASDDLAWLLGDEWCPEVPDIEADLLALFHDADHDGFLCMAALHVCVRIGLILRHKGNGSWWDRDRCMAEDRVGVSAPELLRTLRKLTRWADSLPAIAPLVGLCDQIEQRFLPAYGQ